jgi:hypothetical protein
MADEPVPTTAAAPAPSPSEVINQQASPPVSSSPEPTHSFGSNVRADVQKFFTNKDVALGLGAAAGVTAATVFAAPLITAGVVGAGVAAGVWQGLKKLGIKL